MLRNLIRIPALATLLTLSLAGTPAHATQADFEKHMARGVAALDADTPRAALEEFRAAQTEHPDDPETALYLAIALNRAGDPAAEAALKNALRSDPGNPRINLELGTHYYNRSMYDEAGDYFENLLAQNPDADLTSAARSYLANIRTQSSGKNWSASLTGGIQYDSNVPLSADGVQLPVGIDRRGDWRGVINLGLAAAPYRNNSTELAVSYGLYQTLHTNLSDFDLTQNSLDLTLREQFQPYLAGKVTLSGELIHLGGKQFDRSYSIAPAIILTLSDSATSTLEYRFREAYYENSGMFPTNSDREGIAHVITLGHQHKLSDTLNLRISYTFERELATTDSWSSRSHHGSAGIAIALPYKLLLDISADAVGRSYDAIQNDASEARSDTTLSAAASLTWQINETLAISGGYHYTDNSSTISGYEYRRSITSLMFQGRY
ncbi:MAG TPA: tetratricopeptide repeat protein [Desulfuromonadales bacterium]|nr:tetratricopeptide repeat protein [Desulfuromonadales bacterium]